MYAVILAGGGGTRLWPLSSPERPKPFLPLLGDKSLLQLTADRLTGDLQDRVVNPDSIYVVTDSRYMGLVSHQLPTAKIVAEPVGRNTAAAIALATIAIDRSDDEVMLVLPADQTIQLVEVFKGVLRNAERELALGAFGMKAPLVTLGVETTRPATDYGYLLPSKRRQTRQLDAFLLSAFEEKPSVGRAKELSRQGGVAWNAGMFMWKRGAIRRAFRSFAPEILGPVEGAVRAGTLDSVYPHIRSISIDYAVMEGAARAGKVVMGSMQVGWNDLGSWTSLLGELGMPGIEASIDPTGKAFEAAPDDLLVWRTGAGRLTATPGEDATMVASDGPVAVLRGARRLQSQIEPLLDRCSTLEANP